MPGNRQHRFALIGAIFALTPALAIGASVDAQTTAAIPAQPGNFVNAGSMPAGSIANLKSGLDALSAQEVGRARAVRDSLAENSLDRHILAWAIALRGGDLVPSGDIAAAAQALPGWPGMAALRRNSEKALFRENPAPQTVVRAFGGSQPQTLEGVILLSRAYVALGNRDAARSVLSPFWRVEKLEAKDEVSIINEFGSLIPAADHRFRMERMLYAERVNSAKRVAGFAGAQALTDAWSAVIKGDKGAQKLLDAVPAAQRSAGYMFAQARYLRRGENFAQAAAVMLKAPTDRASLVDPDAWWIERRSLSRELVDKGDMKTAYRIVAAHAAESPTNAADAEFHAGWYALRGLNDAKTAAKHFTRIAELAEGSISKSRAYYWLGRAAEAGGPGSSKAYFERAAGYGTTFYGQLAAERIGQSAIKIAYPSPTAADRRDFAQREAVNAIKRLEDAGYASLADTLYRDLAGQLTSPGELALLAVMAEKRDNHFLALKVGKIAAARGIEIGALSHPIGVIPANANISGSGKALAYAIARQESEFNVAAVSRVGALGLLQLMPGTAKDLARKNGLPYSQARLTTDAGYNAALGAAFLGEQLGRFNGSYVLTFAGYNAGPRRAQDWITRYGDPRGKDVDTVVDWIERIPFSETRSYVQRVMENYQVYKMRLSGKFDIVADLVNGRD
ncbi:lytic transglycosylase domain-containing protein [Mesorhizobium sp. CGMCC 1.15528]|uniref:Lytic transglycosylase domain-containing protein n=1 Tax=Mesorhizobium zhangyense TaxID=1776730 RepID=A0A7C9R884_9HYPH|nr:lytic transglycosylase domain-containing protein [Mesorhizobium zhangyense]NGN40673.1 lytic transglycosylase domain-containing protein [Mesorhizobium zhangyense]